MINVIHQKVQVQTINMILRINTYCIILYTPLGTGPIPETEALKKRVESDMKRIMNLAEANRASDQMNPSVPGDDLEKSQEHSSDSGKISLIFYNYFFVCVLIFLLYTEAVFFLNKNCKLCMNFDNLNL